MVDGRVAKRKATQDGPSPPAQRPCHDTTSIHSLLRANSRERLYVHPICWTLRQPGLLCCHFTLEKVRVEKGDPPSRSVVQILRDQQPYKNPLYAVAQLLAPGTLAAKKFDVVHILPHSLPFFFGQREAARIPTDGLFAHHDALPSLAYITFDTIQTLRKKKVSRPPCGGANRPVWNIHQKRLRSLEPRNPAEDPYIVSILIALAQAQRQHTETKGRAARSFQVSQDRLSWGEAGLTHFPKVTVLATASIAECLYVYTATIPAEFLDRLDTPAQPLRVVPVPVKYCRISLIPGRKALKKLHHLICTGTCTLCVGEEQAGPGHAG
ncbi:hypothetical protein BO78DRAFT_436287 [Aspergillus sclerotiicarbonarius CBS 121057]|uniref:Uncharacterized protein n=1 Tax=Aspergillus sclerotiicarbonarius (strain CBS 121057 / IBT 28362) TaxID=1448318 RepID=A0A319DU24_ASPSB|nr:hypothetical protein BO78DRAFT_436287 [Aspergillus sclerotiicarbonarius CBS 121057]